MSEEPSHNERNALTGFMEKLRGEPVVLMMSGLFGWQAVLLTGSVGGRLDHRL